MKKKNISQTAILQLQIDGRIIQIKGKEQGYGVLFYCGHNQVVVGGIINPDARH